MAMFMRCIIDEEFDQHAAVFLAYSFQLINTAVKQNGAYTSLWDAMLW